MSRPRCVSAGRAREHGMHMAVEIPLGSSAPRHSKAVTTGGIVLLLAATSALVATLLAVTFLSVLTMVSR